MILCRLSSSGFSLFSSFSFFLCSDALLRYALLPLTQGISSLFLLLLILVLVSPSTYGVYDDSFHVFIRFG